MKINKKKKTRKLGDDGGGDLQDNCTNVCEGRAEEDVETPEASSLSKNDVRKKKHKGKKSRKHDSDKVCETDANLSYTKNEEVAEQHEESVASHDDTNESAKIDQENNFNGILSQIDTCKLKKIKQKKKRKIDSVTEPSEVADESTANQKKCKKLKVEDKLVPKEQDVDQESTDKSNEKKEKFPGVEYLLQWKKDRKNWNFKKSQQIKLLRNMYDETKLSDKMFKTLLKYLNELKGKSRDETLIKAREIAEKEPDENDNDESKSQVKTKRALEIVKLLS